MSATIKLNRAANNTEVFAKMFRGTLHAVTYTNQTQASNQAAKLGAGWCVFQSAASRIFYVATVAQFTN
jgi:hypothetical protein